MYHPIYFTFHELCKTHQRIDNFPTWDIIENLAVLGRHLDSIRSRCGKIEVSSGFRTQAVNQKVGGVPRSYHLRGFAADLKPVDFPLGKLYIAISEHCGFNSSEHPNGFEDNNYEVIVYSTFIHFAIKHL